MASRIFRDDLLAGRRALVTGGGTGIGHAAAIELASLGADVAVLGRRADRLEATVAEVAALGRRALALPCDIRDPDRVAAAVGRVVAELGGVDVLVNNAGGHFVSPTEALSRKGWLAVIDANLNGTFHVTQEVAKQAMIPARAGAIVNIVIDMWQGAPGAAHAGAARAAVENLTRTLSAEWACYGIRVNAIAPGTIDTGGLGAYPAEVLEDVRAAIPIGRFGRAEEVAWMIAYLASDAAAFVTGATVCIDGGARNYGGLFEVFAKARSRATSR